jgi:hypothetical protein
LVLTEWDEFRKLDLKKVGEALAMPIVVDGRNIYRPEAVHKAGLEYISMGRRNSEPAVHAIPPEVSTTRRRATAIAVTR